MHFDDVFRLLGDLLLQLAVKVIQKGDVLLALGVVRHKELVAPLAFSVEQPGHGNQIDAVAVRIVEAVVLLIGGKCVEPLVNMFCNRIFRRNYRVDVHVRKLGEDSRRRFVTAEIVPSEIEGKEAFVAGLHKRIDAGIGDVVKTHLPDDNQVHHLRNHVRKRQQLDLIGNLSSAEEGDNRQHLRNKQQYDDFLRHFLLAEIAVNHSRETDGEEHQNKHVEYGM